LVWGEVCERERGRTLELSKSGLVEETKRRGEEEETKGRAEEAMI
jgi:hypothetical protein